VVGGTWLTNLRNRIELFFRILFMTHPRLTHYHYLVMANKAEFNLANKVRCARKSTHTGYDKQMVETVVRNMTQWPFEGRDENVVDLVQVDVPKHEMHDLFRAVAKLTGMVPFQSPSVYYLISGGKYPTQLQVRVAEDSLVLYHVPSGYTDSCRIADPALTTWIVNFVARLRYWHPRPQRFSWDPLYRQHL